MRRNPAQRGNAMIEMTLVGIPLMFMLLCIFEISRAMWVYNTMAHAVKEGVRFAVVHGQTCVSNPPSITNSCAKTVADVANRIKYMGIGIDGSITTVRFTSDAGAFDCLLNDCVNDVSLWPPAGGNGVGHWVGIKISAPFPTALAMLWPGVRQVSFAPFHVGASAGERIRF